MVLIYSLCHFCKTCLWVPWDFQSALEAYAQDTVPHSLDSAPDAETQHKGSTTRSTATADCIIKSHMGLMYPTVLEFLFGQFVQLSTQC